MPFTRIYIQPQKYQRLYEKGYLRNDDTVNIILVKDENPLFSWETNFTKALPGITDELKTISDELDNEIYKIRKNLYPQHMQKLCKAWSTNCFCSNGSRTRVLEQLLYDDVIKLPKNNQKSGLTTLMFCDKLPE